MRYLSGGFDTGPNLGIAFLGSGAVRVAVDEYAVNVRTFSKQGADFLLYRASIRSRRSNDHLGACFNQQGAKMRNEAIVRGAFPQ